MAINLINSPLFTEKSSEVRYKHNQYVFKVDRSANKQEIKKIIESHFNVLVESVNISNYQGKLKKVRRDYGRCSSWKKAYVCLKKGDTISEFEGV